MGDLGISNLKNYSTLDGDW